MRINLEIINKVVSYREINCNEMVGCYLKKGRRRQMPKELLLEGYERSGNKTSYRITTVLQ
jgi:hypothetical protein